MTQNETLPRAVARLAALWAEGAQTTRAAADEAYITIGADMMADQPWRITRAVYPFKPSIWPVPGMTADDVLADCQRFIDAETSRGESNHWSFDRNRLIALRQAEAALRGMA